MKTGSINPLVCIALVSVCALLPAGSARASSEADKPPVLIELFTSEGCSSCPPADGLLQELDRQQFIAGARAIVLSEHVTYWNDLGWKDPFSKPELTERQRRYAAQFRLESTYTPQMVVNGHWEFVGSDAGALTKAVQKAAAEERLHPPTEIRIENLRVTRGVLHATVETGPGQDGSLFAVVAADTASTHVMRGENAGRSLNHVAVVRSLVELARVEAPLKDYVLNLPLAADTPEKMRLILFLQDGRTGRVLGSAEILFNRPQAGI